MAEAEYPTERFDNFVESVLEGEPGLDTYRSTTFKLSQPVLLSLIDAVNVRQDTVGGTIPVEQGGRPKTIHRAIEFGSRLALGGTLLYFSHIEGEDGIGIFGNNGDFIDYADAELKEEQDLMRVSAINVVLDQLEQLHSRGELQEQ